MLYSWLWLEGIQLPETNNKYFFLSIRLCFINVYTYSNPKPTPYSNADALNIVVQREKKDKILMCARAVRYDDIYRMDEIKSLSFHIMFYRLFRGVAKYIVYSTFSSFGWLRSLHATTGREGETEPGGERPELNEGLHL